jgi:hypothetical protein
MICVNEIDLISRNDIEINKNKLVNNKQVKNMG